MKSKLIAAIGSGGKTTALRYLAQKARTQRVLFTTTTHIFPLPASERRILLEDPAAESLRKELAVPGVVCAGNRAEEGKLGRLPDELLDIGTAAAQLTLYEADGAHRRPLKLHRPDEPVLLPGTDCCLVLAGLSALGKPVSQAVHRFDRNDKWREHPDLPVGPEEFLFCVKETICAAKLPSSKLCVLLNQADALSQKETAVLLEDELRRWGLNCRTGSLAQAPGVLDDFEPIRQLSTWK